MAAPSATVAKSAPSAVATRKCSATPAASAITRSTVMMSARRRRYVLRHRLWAVAARATAAARAA